MPKPITPLVGSDVFVLDEKERLLLIRRADNDLWALPGGCNDLGETPAACAVRECREESGLEVELISLMGVWSSTSYEYVHYPWKENEFCHLMFEAKVIGGEIKISEETKEVAWFSQDDLPALSDGHEIRIQYGFDAKRNPDLPVYFE